MLRFAILKEINHDQAKHMAVLKGEVKRLPEGEFRQRMLQIIEVNIPEHIVVAELPEEVVKTLFKSFLCDHFPKDQGQVLEAIDAAWDAMSGLLKKEVVRRPELI